MNTKLLTAFAVASVEALHLRQDSLPRPTLAQIKALEPAYHEYCQHNNRVNHSAEEEQSRLENYAVSTAECQDQMATQVEGDAQCGDTKFSDWSREEKESQFGTHEANKNAAPDGDEDDGHAEEDTEKHRQGHKHKGSHEHGEHQDEEHAPTALLQHDCEDEGGDENADPSHGLLPNCALDTVACKWGDDHVSAVKNQGQCGSCYTFTATAVMESAFAIKHGALLHLSEQQLVDCSWYDSGCNGGWMMNTWYYAGWVPVVQDVDYPYQGSVAKCDYWAESDQSVQVSKRSYVSNSETSADELRAAIAKGPVGLAIEANSDWLNYKGGVLKGSSCGANVNHAVTAIGWGRNLVTGDDYVLIRNSWGADWGEDGNIRVAIDDTINNGYGTCGIHMYGMYAEVY